MTAPALLTEAEAAEALRISPRTLREIRRRGGIRYVRSSPRTILYDPEDIAAYVNQAKCQDVAPSASGRSAKMAAARNRGNVVRFTQRQR